MSPPNWHGIYMAISCLSCWIGDWMLSQASLADTPTILARRATRLILQHLVCFPETETYAIPWHVSVGTSAQTVLQSSVNNAISTTFEYGLIFSEF